MVLKEFTSISTPGTDNTCCPSLPAVSKMKFPEARSSSHYHVNCSFLFNDIEEIGQY